MSDEEFDTINFGPIRDSLAKLLAQRNTGFARALGRALGVLPQEEPEELDTRPWIPGLETRCPYRWRWHQQGAFYFCERPEGPRHGPFHRHGLAYVHVSIEERFDR